MNSLTDLNQNQLGSSLSLLITNTIKKFQSLTHKTLLLILAKFSLKISLCATDNYRNAHDMLRLTRIIYYEKNSFRI